MIKHSDLRKRALCGVNILIDSQVIKWFRENVSQDDKADISVDLDGEVKKFTLEEFKERLFKEEFVDSQFKEQDDKKLPGLKRPMQSILIADVQVMAKVIKGEKKITIRKGFRDFVVGKVVFVIDSVFGVATLATIKKIVKVKWKLLKDVTQEEMFAEDFKDVNDMLEGLRRFYPEIGLSRNWLILDSNCYRVGVRLLAT